MLSVKTFLSRLDKSNRSQLQNKRQILNELEKEREKEIIAYIEKYGDKAAKNQGKKGKSSKKKEFNWYNHLNKYVRPMKQKSIEP